MEFLKHLKNGFDNNRIREMVESYKELGLADEDCAPQISDGIYFNNGIILSIQGSYGHYCEPRKTLPYNKYTKMEFAIIIDNEFHSVQDVLPNNNDYDEYYNDTVYGYVPVALIEELYQELKSKYGLKENKNVEN